MVSIIHHVLICVWLLNAVYVRVTTVLWDSIAATLHSPFCCEHLDSVQL